MTLVPPRYIKDPYDPNAVFTYEDETVNDVKIFIDTWKSFEAENNQYEEVMSYFDADGVMMIAHLFDGFMVKPVAKLGKYTLGAKAKSVGDGPDAWLDMIGYLEELKQTHKIYLYMLTYRCSFPAFCTFDLINFEPKITKVPVMTKAGWTIRYAAITNEEFERATSP